MEHPDIERAMKTGYPIEDKRYEEELPPLEEPENDSPVEDHFGYEIKDGDEWFEDEQGRVFLMENVKYYLLHFAGIKKFRTAE